MHKSINNRCKQKNNEYYSSLNGSLYNKNQTELVQYAIGKNDTIFAIPDSVKSIGNDAFKFCTSLTSVTIPDSVTSIGYRAFYQCKSLESVTISDSVTSIGFKAFYETAYYNNPDNWDNDVLYIGKHLIEAKDTLSGEYNIKSGTLTVADSAFYGRNNYDTEKFETPVTGITIPDSVTSIGDGAFSANRSLSTINVSINNEYYSSLNGSLYNKSQTELVQYAIGKNDTIFAIPDSVKSIGNDAFSWCANLKYITIPNTVNYIGADAFYNCASLESISLPEGVTEIYDGTFSGCNNLNYVFYNGYQSNLSIGNFNGLLTSVIKYAKYKGTFSGGEWYFDYTTGVLRITGNGNMEFGNSQTIPWSEHKNDIKSVVIESGTTSIADNAFTCCTSLSSVTIPNTISNIGESSFKGCEALMSLSIPDSVKSIGEEAFTDCKSLTSVTIGMGCKSISSKAFWDCPKLNKITVKYPNCIFDNSQYTISTTAVICGYKNSTAYTYARSYMRSFEDIETGIKYGWIDGSFIEIPTEIDPTNPTEPISSENWVVVKAPTCDESGVEVNYAAQKSRIVPALGHDYSDEFTIDKVATCTEDGLKSKHCSRCDSTTEKTIIPKTSHRPSSDWIIVKEATTTEESLAWFFYINISRLYCQGIMVSS